MTEPHVMTDGELSDAQAVASLFVAHPARAHDETYSARFSALSAELDRRRRIDTEAE
jgi:hypothetical protein